MDKQQATQHTINRLRVGDNVDEISDELSLILNAPVEITKRFVAQVIANHPEAIPAPSPTKQEDQPEWMQSIVAELPTESEPVSFTSQSDQSTYNDLPPNLIALLGENNSYIESVEMAPSQEPVESPDMDLPRQAKFVPPSEETGDNKDGEELQSADLEKLAEYVLGQLKKQRRHNDIVETVCQRTGWHWNKSQRFVARVKTKNHEQLQTGQNRVTIIIGIGIILVGLVMTLNGANTIADYAKIVAFAKTNPEALLSISPQPIIFALAATISGIGMIIGGGYGVGRAMTNH